MTKLHPGSLIGTKYFLLSLIGYGVADGYHNSLEELEKATFSYSVIVVKNHKEQKGRIGRLSKLIAKLQFDIQEED
ncbi:hypothetical protein ACFYKT_16420 [Cytobacillus sp. FJAT-53684]|uniref:Uncharacterized protein n=1 Tax=Cytobacillus mangrovibacter TaxID=3299024 RepID=A0ABW6K2W6_9BACI